MSHCALFLRTKRLWFDSCTNIIWITTKLWPPKVSLCFYSPFLSFGLSYPLLVCCLSSAISDCFSFAGLKVTLKGVVLRALRVAIKEALQSPIEKEVQRYMSRRKRRLGKLARHVIAQELAEEMAEDLAVTISINIPQRLRRRLSAIVRDDIEDMLKSRGYCAMVRKVLNCAECQHESSSSEDGGKLNLSVCGFFFFDVITLIYYKTIYFSVSDE